MYYHMLTEHTVTEETHLSIDACAFIESKQQNDQTTKSSQLSCWVVTPNNPVHTARWHNL